MQIEAERRVEKLEDSATQAEEREQELTATKTKLEQEVHAKVRPGSES